MGREQLFVNTNLPEHTVDVYPQLEIETHRTLGMFILDRLR